MMMMIIYGECGKERYKKKLLAENQEKANVMF